MGIIGQAAQGAILKDIIERMEVIQAEPDRWVLLQNFLQVILKDVESGWY